MLAGLIVLKLLMHDECQHFSTPAVPAQARTQSGILLLGIEGRGAMHPKVDSAQRHLARRDVS